jgi:hypothetical protein
MVGINRIALSLVLTSVVALSQEPSGSVNGTIFYEDSRLPARMATVTLAPLASLIPGPATGAHSQQATVSGTVSLDGTFSFDQVAAGRYVVLVDASGYLSPAAGVSAEMFGELPKDKQVELLRNLTTVTVTSNTASSVHLAVTRGAAISGTVRYDDGAPAEGLSVHVLRGENGRWVEFQPSSFGRIYHVPDTDDRGLYRISGLPEGKYMVMLEIDLKTSTISNVVGRGGASIEQTSFRMPVYVGDVFRKEDAKVIEVTRGQEIAGEDVYIPLQHLRALAGVVVASSDDHPINAGVMNLVDPKTQVSVAKTKVGSDGKFIFPFVPEGDYQLDLSDVRDVIRTEVANPPGSMPAAATIEKTLKTYAPLSLPIKVEQDIKDDVVSVPR